jgi:hypothetical protein
MEMNMKHVGKYIGFDQGYQAKIISIVENKITFKISEQDFEFERRECQSIFDALRPAAQRHPEIVIWNGSEDVFTVYVEHWNYDYLHVRNLPETAIARTLTEIFGWGEINIWPKRQGFLSRLTRNIWRQIN